MENCPKEDDDQAEEAIASAPSVDDIDIRVHKLEKLRMTEINAAGKGSQGDGEPKEWTVIYSDSNSSVLSEADEDVADEVSCQLVHSGNWVTEWFNDTCLIFGKQVHILKQLQDDLLVCMKHQNIKDDGSEYPQDHYQVRY